MNRRAVDEFDYLSEDPSFRRRYWICTRHYDEQAPDDIATRALEEILVEVMDTIGSNSRDFHYAVGQVETGEKDLRPHIQLFIHAAKRFRSTTLRDTLEDPHLFARSMTFGNADAMRKYCMKTEGRLAEPRHWPSSDKWRPPKMQQVEDDDILEGFIGIRNPYDGKPFSPAVLFEVHPGAAMRRWRFLDRWWERVTYWYGKADSLREAEVKEVEQYLNSLNFPEIQRPNSTMDAQPILLLDEEE